MSSIIGNVIALAASVFMVYSGIVKQKKKVLYAQSIQIGLFVISNLVLNGISGAIINTVSFVRNVLCYKNKLGFREKIILTVLSVVPVLLFNNLGFIGFLPLINNVVYLWLMTIKGVIKFKILMIFTIVLWCVYDFAIGSYTSGLFDVITIFANIISIIKIKKLGEVR